MGTEEASHDRAATEGAFVIIDSHTHVWSNDPGRYPWQPTFGYVPKESASPEVLLERMDAEGIDRALLVQPTVYGSDHRFLLDTVDAHPDRFIPLGQVDPAEAASVGIARGLVASHAFVGLRVVLSPDLPRARAQLVAPAWDELVGLGVPISLRAMPRHHHMVTTILARYPLIRFVVDHLGLPGMDDWHGGVQRLEELARHENCFVKLAGARQFDGEAQEPDALVQLVRAGIDAFGPARVAWGSNFPGVDERSALSSALADVAELSFLGDEDRLHIMGGTAAQLWAI